MNFDADEVHANYHASRSRYRELGKWVFSICTLGLGGLHLWGSTLVIKEGQVGLREDARGNMILLPPGRHSNFPWESYPVRPRSLSEKVIELGPYKIITVESGFIAKTVDKGNLTILNEGQHLLTEAAHVFDGFVPVKQETKRLEEVTAYTDDNVGISLHADVQYQIVDPDTAIRRVDDVEKSIREISEMQISKVVGHHNLSELIAAASGVSSALEEEDSHNGMSEVVAELIKNLGTQLQQLGIHLLNIGIKSWTINDTHLAHELAQGAVIQSQTASRMITAQRDAEITEIKAKAQANAMIEQAKGDAQGQKIRAQGLLDAAETIRANPAAIRLADWQAQRDIVEAAQPGTQLFYGSTGAPGFFQLPLTGVTEPVVSPSSLLDNTSA